MTEITTWDHVSCTISRDILNSETRWQTSLCRAFQLANRFVADSILARQTAKEIIDQRFEAIREMQKALEAGDDLFDDAGNFVGNTGPDLGSAREALERFWRI